jgi:ribonuclease kappa
MSLAFYVKSVALIEDLPINDAEVIPSSQGNIGIVVDEMNKQYEQQALNCSIAAALYLLTLLVSIHQFRLNNNGRMNSN